MKQIIQNYRSGVIKVGDAPAPRNGEGSLLVATTASLISSGTEKQLIDLAKASLVGKAIARPDLVRRVVRNFQRDGLKPTMEKVFAKLDTPIPLGYSIAGRVVEAGRRSGGHRVGDRVACAGAGLANHAQINTVPKNLVVPIPANVDDEDASFVTIGAIALQGVRQANLTLGERVVVVGLGLIGLLTVQILKASGCRVLGYDPNAMRVALALKIGADSAVADGLVEAVASFTSGHGADAVILTASSKSSEPLNLAAEISRIKGRIVVVGLVGMTIDREPFYKRELDVRLSLSYGPGRHDPNYEQAGHDYPLPYVRWTEQRNMEAFLHLVGEGRVTPKALVTHRFSIGEAERAYKLMESGEPHLAILLDYPGNRDVPVERQLRQAPVAVRDHNRCGVAFIGFGDYAKGVMLPLVRKSAEVTLTAVVTNTSISASHAGSKYGFEVIATEPEAAINDPATDTIFIATRHDTHASLTAAALRAGKNVFCEKPLALDLDSLADVETAAAEAAGVLTVGFNRRFAPLMLKAKAALEPRSGPLVMLYRINAGSIPAVGWQQRDEGGGRILGEVCHFVDTLTFLCGSLPVDVRAVAARGHDDAVSILIGFADGSTGTIVYSSLGDPGVGKEYVEVFGDGRVVQLTDFISLTVTKKGQSTTTKLATEKGQAGLLKAFFAATAPASAPIPYDQLFAVSAATLAIETALSQGRVAPVPYQAETDATAALSQTQSEPVSD